MHGDFHLGQVLVVQSDAYIIDFEGEPARTMEQRPQRRVGILAREQVLACQHAEQPVGPIDHRKTLVPEGQ